MRILLLGKTGQLAIELVQLNIPGWSIYAAGRPEVDVRDIDTIYKLSKEYRPDLLVNAAAYTAVDKAESEQEQAFAVNETGAANVARVAESLGIPCIYFSTDYIFDGTASEPYKEGDTSNPLNIYGRSKEAGECAVRKETQRHIIFRTSWVYSPFSTNFVKTMLTLMPNKSELKVVNDQVGSPSAALDIAKTTQAVISYLDGGKEAYGTYHLSGGGNTSWYGFAVEIQKIARVIFDDSWPGKHCEIVPVSTTEYGSATCRPYYSVLNNDKLMEHFRVSLPVWQDSLKECIQRIYLQQEQAT